MFNIAVQFLVTKKMLTRQINKNYQNEYETVFGDPYSKIDAGIRFINKVGQTVMI